jgi:hypothetical protein
MCIDYKVDGKAFANLPFKLRPGEQFAANSQSYAPSRLQMYDTSPLLRGFGWGFVDIRKDLLLFCFPSQNYNNRLQLSLILNIYQVLYLFLCQKFWNLLKVHDPRKQQTNVDLQKGTENATEAI